MIGNQDQAFWEVGEQISLSRLQQFPPDAFVAADSNDSGGPALGHTSGEKAPRLLGECDPRIIPVFVDEVERRAEELRSIDSGCKTDQPGLEDLGQKCRSYAIQPEMKYVPNASALEAAEYSPLRI